MKKFPDLESSNIPLIALTMRDIAEKRNGVHRVVTRDRSDGYRNGEDLSLTINRGHAPSKRVASDTPRPSSPNPYDTGESMQNTRYEQSHQEPFQFTGNPGHTVWGPVQANQVVDTHHEKFVSDGGPGSFSFRRDTYEGSSTFSARRRNSGTWETIESSNQRRVSTTLSTTAGTPLSPNLPLGSSTSSPPPMSPGGHSSSSNSVKSPSSLSSSSVFNTNRKSY
ncbi:hypothetical protein [Undibacterium sp. Xuan67W]|uniref:hypothetical protein n=1 Tax=Undibacterium sp. Xuan67W TaxID=3413057 RepID=UPI003BF18BEF